MLFPTDPTVTRLEELSILAALSGRDRRKLARHFQFISVEPGRELIHEGALNHFTYFILNGTVDVRVCGATVATLGADSVVGERTMLGEISTNAAVTAISKVEALAIDHRVLRGVADDHPEIRHAIESVAARRTVAA
jgi:CRP-like cAMP-binding protein